MQADWNTRVISFDIFEKIARIKLQSDDYILCYGGSQLISALQMRNHIDKYALFINPNALGAGLPLYREATSLHLLDVSRFHNGTLGLR